MNAVNYGYSLKSVDKYIRTRIKYWIYNLGKDAPRFLNEELALGWNESQEELTDAQKEIILNFQKQVQSYVIVTGGCFTSMLQGEEPNDLDIYLEDKATAVLISQFYLNKMRIEANLTETAHVPQICAKETDDGVTIMLRSQGVASEDIDNSKYKYFEMHPEEATDAFFAEYKKTLRKRDIEEVTPGNSYKVSFLTSNAITLNNGLQIIIRFTGNPETIHTNFDFIHATNYWTWEEGVVYNVDALRATHERRLYYFGSKFPVATIFRMKKFIERGWRISAGEMVKIMYDISHLDLDRIEVLREQSMGMDSAYFSQVIAKLRESDRSDLDRTYLFKVLDLVFQMYDKQDDFLESKGEEETGEDATLC